VAQLSTLGLLAHVMESPKTLKIAVTVLGVALLVSLGCLFWMVRQIHVWRDTVDTVAEQAGGQWALACFRADKLMVYQMDVGAAETNGMPIFSGRRDGPFEVWLYPDYTELSMQARYGQRKVIEAFDAEMRSMYKHPKFYRQESGQTNSTVINDKK